MKAGWLSDLAEARWVEERLRVFDYTVGSVVPDYPAYARLEHRDPDSRAGHLGLPERGRLVEHLRRYTDEQRPCWFAYGERSVDEQDVVARLALPGRPSVVRKGPLDLAMAPVPAAKGVFFVGSVPVGSSQRLEDDPGWGTTDVSPSVMWPADRSWFVVTDFDLTGTYVGGPRALIDELLADPALTCFTADPGHLIVAPPEEGKR